MLICMIPTHDNQIIILSHKMTVVTWWNIKLSNSLEIFVLKKFLKKPNAFNVTNAFSLKV